MPRTTKFIEVENFEVHALIDDDVDDHRSLPIRVDFNIFMYLASAYMLAYFFLTFFLVLIYLSASTETEKCMLNIKLWYEVSAVFYFLAFASTATIIFLIRKAHLTIETVTLRSMVVVFHNYKKNWLFLYLLLIEAIHLTLTIIGSYMNFNELKDLLVCYLEIPLLANFMFILIILGYIYVLRMIVTVFHFWFGYRIYVWMKHRCGCLARDELHLKEKFPVYGYEDYVEAI